MSARVRRADRQQTTTELGNMELELNEVAKKVCAKRIARADRQFIEAAIDDLVTKLKACEPMADGERRAGEGYLGWSLAVQAVGSALAAHCPEDVFDRGKFNSYLGILPGMLGE